MLIKGNLSSEKTEILAENYVRLINSGVDASEILVLVQNSNLKNNFIDKILGKINVEVLEKLQVYSFFGLVYNTISDNWVFVENSIPDGNTVILPNLIGLEISQFLLKEILKTTKFEGYNSKKSLLNQLFRRYSLIVQNNLSDEDVMWRADTVLKEAFADDAKITLRQLLAKTLSLRAFDYLRQALIFNHIYKHTDYFKKIKYLVIDDGDEITPICFEFVKFLSKQLNEVFIAYDAYGASRIGYLSAQETAVYSFEEVFNQKPEEIFSDNKMENDAQVIYNNVVAQNSSKLKNFALKSPSKRAQMLDFAVEQIKKLLSGGVLPKDILIITPVIDDMLKFCLKEQLNGLLFLSGSEKLIQNPLVSGSLAILKMSMGLVENLSEFDLRVVLSGFLKIPIKYCKTVLEKFEQTKTLVDCEFVVDEYALKYDKLRGLVDKLSATDLKMSERICRIYEDLAEFKSLDANEINKFTFFVKQIEDFESVFGEDVSKEAVINQVENSIIAENPYSTLDLGEDNLVVATPQKVIDNQISSKYQIWLDVSSDEWIKSDTGPLYNAWVFQAGWSKDEFTIDDNIRLGREKTARILRKLILCAKESVFAYASLFDSNGIENFGGIEKYLNSNEPDKIATTFSITPREDQKPVLAYSEGKMAISAVPGAGKTTILLALIIKLLESGINPENIYVLTYMESAARNFREKIKNVSSNTSQLPNISTIHGLALKILKEDGNFERLGLNSDFEICDDSQRSRIVKEIGVAQKLKKTELDDFDRAVSVLKLSGGNSFPQVTDAKLKKFIEFFNAYDKTLKNLNLIDYDDMLLSSVRLLEENKDVLLHYQDICRYIIEDEAQDSSLIQQRLINLLSAKYQNLVRCGDINQAITTTFSNADVEGFRKFIADNRNVSMDCSQRSCSGVWELANDLVRFADNSDFTKNAFYKIFMRPVEGRNPVSPNAIEANIFQKTAMEKNHVLHEINSLLKKNKAATVGILLRNNFQVAQWASFVTDAGFKAITRNECLEQKGVFRTIFAVMKMILAPFDNENIAECYETLSELGFYRQRLQTEIRKMQSPFVQMSADDIENLDLSRFYWDLTYWLNFSTLAGEELAIKIGLHYYDSEIEKSNVYLIATLIKRISNSNKDYRYIIERLEELSKKPSLSGFKFFSEEDESDRGFLAGKVQIMTMHKSKGDEFDYVFLPEMTEKSLTLDYNELKIKSSSGFMESVRAFNPNYRRKTDDEMKEFLLAENLRLLYVAITRAKRKLYFSCSTIAKSFGKEIKQNPSLVFTEILEGVKTND